MRVCVNLLISGSLSFGLMLNFTPLSMFFIVILVRLDCTFERLLSQVLLVEIAWCVCRRLHGVCRQDCDLRVLLLWQAAALEALEGVSCEVIDLRTLLPWDRATVGATPPLQPSPFPSVLETPDHKLFSLVSGKKEITPHAALLAPDCAGLHNESSPRKHVFLLCSSLGPELLRGCPC